MNLPHVAKRAFGDQMGPNMQKAMPPGSPSHQGLKNCGNFYNNVFSFLTIFFILAIFGRFCAVGHVLMLAYFLAVFGSIRLTKCKVGCKENPYFKRLADLRQIWPYSRYRDHIQ